MSIFEGFRRNKGKSEKPENQESLQLDLQTQHVCELLDLRKDELEEAINHYFLEGSENIDEQFERLEQKGYVPENILAEGTKIVDSLDAMNANSMAGKEMVVANMALTEKYTELKHRQGKTDETYLKLGLMAKVATQAYHIVKICQPDITPQEAREISNRGTVLDSKDNMHRARVKQFVEERNTSPSTILEKEQFFIHSLPNEKRQEQYKHVATMLNKESKIEPR